MRTGRVEMRTVEMAAGDMDADRLTRAPSPGPGAVKDQAAIVLLRSAVALVLELRFLYPSRTFVFLARDMEHHFLVHSHLRRLGLIPDAPSILLHLSRTSIHAPDVDAYLSEALPAGKGPFLVVDTGFFGSIAFEIGRRKAQADVLGHLLCSFEATIPDSEYALSFLAGEPPSTRSGLRALVQGAIEHLPHRHRKVERFRSSTHGVVAELVPTDVETRAAADGLAATLASLIESAPVRKWIEREAARLRNLAALLDFVPPRPVCVVLPDAYRMEGPGPAGVEHRRFLTLLRKLGASGKLSSRWASDPPHDADRHSVPLEALDPAAADRGLSLARAADGLFDLDPTPLDRKAVNLMRADPAGRGLLLDCLRAAAAGRIERPIHEARLRALWRLGLTGAAGGAPRRKAGPRC